MATMQTFIQNLPKVELHLHIEGSFEPELVFEIARRNQLQVKIERPAPSSPEQKMAVDRLCKKAADIGAQADVDSMGGVKIVFEEPSQLAQAYNFENLQEFLDIYYAGMNVLQTEQDFYDLTMAYLKKCKDQNIQHVEIFFDPQGHTQRGIEFSTVIEGIHNALAAGKREFAISSGLIMCFLRHLSEEDALITWQQAKPHLDKIIGVGLDSSELGHPPSKFKKVFAQAKAAGLKVVAHAGEEGPPAYVWEALDVLQVDRIDHGNRSLEDSQLVDRLIAERKTLTVCPLSNNKLQVVEDLRKHPIKHMLDLGLKVCVNSDDPAYFGGYMNENLNAIQQALNLDQNDLYRLALNAIEGSFTEESNKEALRLALDDYQKSIKA